ncbi:DUF421 domain-containing protein [Olivibacter sp. SDN3]|nr:DUF421 domain-containing protein [Olivibacter sp. SDN3]
MEIDWYRIFFEKLNLEYALEIVARTMVMFVIVLVIIRLSGKRGVRQLSIFEVAIIISLGSAAGDPMFYKDVAIIPAFLVCSTIIIAYRSVTWFTAKSRKIEKWVEGNPIYIIENGMFAIDNISKDSLAMDEFFAELRQVSVTHLGQVETAILETNGNISVFFFPTKDIRYGLPILPKVYGKQHVEISAHGTYACVFCGNPAFLASGKHTCNRCGKNKWIAASNSDRIK